MGDEDRPRLISEFCKVTGADPVRAEQYLTATGWDYNLAISSYFEESDDIETSDSMFPRPASPKPPPKSKAASSNRSRIATFASLRQSQAESDEEEGQAFYAGGSERSGQQVLGPSRRNVVNEIVQDMFKAVKTFGAEEVDHSKKSGGSKIKAFRGTGYVLGATSNNCNNKTGSDRGAEEQSEPLDIALKLWQSGFTVDDGPLREYNDSQNREFLDTIRKGEIPMELRHKANGGEVHVKLEDHSHEEYVPKKTSVRAFAGTGFRLGNVAPSVTSPPSSDSSQKTVSEAQKSVNIDESKPVTSLQIRLADGSRLTMQANHTHTIGAVRRFIVEARPEYATTLFSLLSSFPPKELTDDSATLEEENLINSVVVQKIKK